MVMKVMKKLSTFNVISSYKPGYTFEDDICYPIFLHLKNHLTLKSACKLKWIYLNALFC